MLCGFLTTIKTNICQVASNTPALQKTNPFSHGRELVGRAKRGCLPAQRGPQRVGRAGVRVRGAGTSRPPLLCVCHADAANATQTSHGTPPAQPGKSWLQPWVLTPGRTRLKMCTFCVVEEAGCLRLYFCLPNSDGFVRCVVSRRI